MKNFPSQVLNLLRLVIKKDLILPFTLIATYLVFLIVARGVVPTSEELIDLFADFYAKYGYEIIFISALLEGLVLVNLFVPGMLALALGAIFARTGETDLTLVILTASFGIILGYTIDFLMGYFGFGDTLNKLGYEGFLNTSKQKLKQFGNRGLIVGFFHSNVGSFLAFASGTMRLGFLNFLIVAIASTLVWATLWGLTAYFLGEIFLNIIKRYSFLLVILVVALFILASFWKYRSEVKPNS